MFTLSGSRSALNTLFLIVGAQSSGPATPPLRVMLIVTLNGTPQPLFDGFSEDDLLALERSAFLALIQTPATLARIEQMLETGKPLRN